ncbi:golgin subfamily A member 6-like protein 22 [Nylanderia fulva]|uniref:golgin subfamily A member 6-like protein 22 n=1 Tax=Nylanderia fulva TaxID=613905 RepID=UPI0010FAE4A4|nr:golgin subfamily A member 6-like protein 22 [Nylanderia fulva]
MGEEGGWWKEEEEEEEEYKRNRISKDKKVNKEGKILKNFLGERGWGVLNGGGKGDEEGEYTYTGARGNSVIDYIIVSRETKEKIERMEVGDKVDSDHHPIVAWIEGETEEKKEKRQKKERRGIWDEERRKKFKEKLGEIKEEEREMQDEIESINKRIRKALEMGVETSERKEKKSREWWNTDCAKMKKTMRKSLRKWRKGKGEEEEYKELKKAFREKCEERKKEEEERLIREIGEARTDKQVWEIVNRERRKRKKVNEEIEEEGWRE